MAILGLVDPAEWVKRTKLTFGGGRGPKLMMIDKAYEEYFRLRTDENKKKLFRHLDDYLIEKGRNWEKVSRDKASGGLMKYIHQQTRDRPLARNVLEKRIPESRHGLIYLWLHAEVQTQWAKILLEGALSVGTSAASVFQASNYDPGDKLEHLGTIAKASDADTAIKWVSHAPKVAKMLVAPAGKGIKPESPKPEIKLAAFGPQPTALERAKAFFGNLFEKVWKEVYEQIQSLWTKMKLKFSRGGYVGTIGGTLVSLVNFILGKVAKHAAPLAGNAITIAQGLAKVISAAKDRILAHQARKKFVVSPGHPMLIANAIETQMNWAIAAGVYDAAKGGIQLAGNVASWGASALIDVIAAAVEFAYKILNRILESYFMRDWIKIVKERCGNRNQWKADPKDGVWRPTIVWNDDHFNALVELGCTASPCVPMLTLNSGVSGDQMTFMKMFDDTGGILGQGTGISSDGDKPSATAQAQFDAGTEYFTQLKEWGRNYLASTGFTFTSTDKTAKGLMYHAINSHKGGPMSGIDMALAFASGG